MVRNSTGEKEMVYSPLLKIMNSAMLIFKSSNSQPQRKGKTSIRNKYNSLTIINIDTTPRILRLIF